MPRQYFVCLHTLISGFVHMYVFSRLSQSSHSFAQPATASGQLQTHSDNALITCSCVNPITMSLQLALGLIDQGLRRRALLDLLSLLGQEDGIDRPDSGYADSLGLAPCSIGQHLRSTAPPG